MTYFSQKKPDTKKCKEYDSIYVQFKKRQIHEVKEVRTAVIFERYSLERGSSELPRVLKMF